MAASISRRLVWSMPKGSCHHLPMVLSVWARHVGRKMARPKKATDDTSEGIIMWSGAEEFDDISGLYFQRTDGRAYGYMNSQDHHPLFTRLPYPLAPPHPRARLGCSTTLVPSFPWPCIATPAMSSPRTLMQLSMRGTSTSFLKEVEEPHLYTRRNTFAILLRRLPNQRRRYFVCPLLPAWVENFRLYQPRPGIGGDSTGSPPGSDLTDLCL